jgi:hypothetical protein
MEERENGHYVVGGLKLIDEFMKGIFVAWLQDERIKMIVKTKGEEGSIAQLKETAIQEECEVKSQKFKSNLKPMIPWYQRYVKHERQGSQMSPIKREVNISTEPRCFRCVEEGHVKRNCQNPSQYFKYGRREPNVHDNNRQENRRQEGLGSRGLTAARGAAE